MSLTNKEHIIKKIKSGEIQWEVYSNRMGMLSIRINKDPHDEIHIEDGVSIDEMIDALANHMVEKADIEIMSNLEAAIHSIASAKGKEHGVDYDIDDLLPYTLALIERVIDGEGPHSFSHRFPNIAIVYGDGKEASVAYIDKSDMEALEKAISESDGDAWLDLETVKDKVFDELGYPDFSNYLKVFKL